MQGSVSPIFDRHLEAIYTPDNKNDCSRVPRIVIEDRGIMRKYTIILEPDPEVGGYTVTVPALPGCITQGETVEQCIERAQEAIAGYIESLYGASSSCS